MHNSSSFIKKNDIEVSKVAEGAFYLCWNPIAGIGFPTLEPIGDYTPGMDYVIYPISKHQSHDGKECWYLNADNDFILKFYNQSFYLRRIENNYLIQME
jgi:hypothetical protein